MGWGCAEAGKEGHLAGRGGALRWCAIACKPFFATNCAVLSTIARMSGGGTTIPTFTISFVVGCWLAMPHAGSAVTFYCSSSQCMHGHARAAL